MIVAIAVGNAAAVQDQTIVKKRTFSLSNGRHLLNQIGKLLDVMDVDFGNFFLFLLAFAMMRQVVVPLRGTDLGIASVVPFISIHKSQQSSGIALDAQGNHVYQGIDTSFLLDTLTAAIQQQQEIISDLKDRIEPLENK